MKPSIEKYLKHIQHFSLGNLTTESFHYKTQGLSQLVKQDLNSAIKALKEVDEDALRTLLDYEANIYELYLAVSTTLKKGNKVYISGCGATGRLAISLETLFREKFDSEQVIGFMAGGDYALIKSVESFEDSLDYGKKQLQDLKISKDDLLIGVTEGGETSFVIGTIHEALQTCKQAPWFVYCNPDNELLTIERSKDILLNPDIRKCNLTVGPMAISGSTRMQATTVQMLAVGLCLFYSYENYHEFQTHFKKTVKTLLEQDYHFLKDLIQYEASVYDQSGHMTYKTSSELGVCVLTDTTERSPTFSLPAFESQADDPVSLVYLSLLNSNYAEEAWSKLLLRKPRCLDWNHINESINYESLMNFDISQRASKRRKNLNLHKELVLLKKRDQLSFKIDDFQALLSLATDDLFLHHMTLKLLLNTHSTLVMGLMGRFESNIMTYVKPSNLKLINRSVRYVEKLLELENIQIEHFDIIKVMHQLKIPEGQASVLAIYEAIKQKLNLKN